jgi:hypothetical protein
LLDCHSFHKLLYYLIIAEELATSENSEEWLTKFLEKGGVQHLIAVFDTVNITPNLESQLVIKYFSVIMNLLKITF